MGFIYNFNVSTLPLWSNVLIVSLMVATIALGAHWVVESAVRMAKRFGVSELVIGLTIVSFGTSAPEFAVTLLAALRDQGDISIGNIVGSNIFNLGFILGGCALVRAIPTSPTLVWRDGLVLLFSTLLLLGLLGGDLSLTYSDGFIFIFCLLFYLGYLYKHRSEIPVEEKNKKDLISKTKELEDTRESKLIFDLVLLSIGLALIIGGSHFLVDSATVIARSFGVSDWVIGVTIIAAGTSAPELATSLMAVIKERYAISAGNLIGSDIFNILGVLGITVLLKPILIEDTARMSLLSLTGMVFLVLVMMRSGWKLSRLEGTLLLILACTRWYLDFSNHIP